MKTLKDILNDAYSAQVMRVGHIDGARVAFMNASKDDAFLADARAELTRCEAVKERCFVSKMNSQFLRDVLSRCPS